MGGFNKKTGVFSLTQSKAGVWCRKRNSERLGLIEHCAKLLRDAGHEVLSVHGNFLEVKAMPGQVWEALSGQPSDPERESHHSVTVHGRCHCIRVLKTLGIARL